MADLSLRNITKIYDNKVKAVDSFSMEIADKEFIVFVGPSGCGKSTTLRMIAGLEEITSGELYIDGKFVNDDEPKDRDIAMVFQNYALYPHMTVYQNMAFGLKMRKIRDIKRDKEGKPILDKEGNEIKVLRHYSKQEIDKRVMEAAKILDIEEYMQRKPKALSGGQRQRVALGRAIVRYPKVFLLDEPLSNLDAKLRASMRTEITKLHQKVQTTFIYVTHDQVEAMTMGTRIVIMKDGLIQQIGTPQEVFNSPVNMFVAGFIGTPQMNFLDGELDNDGDKITLKVGEAQIELPQTEALKNYYRQPTSINVGIRPEHMTLADPTDKGALKAKIEINEMMGSEVYLHLTCLEKQITVRIPTTELSLEEQMSLKYGNEIYLTFNGKLAHLFDKESTDNILA